jgi:NAD+ synthase
MSTLHAIGQCVDGRVINTSNLSEDMVGYAIQPGTHVGAYAPLQGLTVTEVKVLGRYLIGVLNLSGWDYHNNALTNLVTGVNLTYEQRLGFTYTDLDKFIRFNDGSDELKEMIRETYKKNKFNLEIVQMPQPDFSHLNNFVKDY